MHINHFLRLGLALGAVLMMAQVPPGQAQEASGSQSDITGTIITTGDTAGVGQPGAVINIAPIVTNAVTNTVPTVTSELGAVVNGTGTLSTTLGDTTTAPTAGDTTTAPTAGDTTTAPTAGDTTAAPTAGGTTIAVPPEIAPVVYVLTTGQTVTPPGGTAITSAQAVSTTISNLEALPNVSPEQAQTIANALQGLLAPGTSVSLEKLATAVNSFNAGVTASGPAALTNPTLIAIRAVLAPLVNSFYAAVEE